LYLLVYSAYLPSVSQMPVSGLKQSARVKTVSEEGENTIMNDSFQGGHQGGQTGAAATRQVRVEPGLQEHTLPPNRSVPSSGMDDIQRWVSGLGGAALLFYGMRQHNVSRLPLAALGAGLLYQGASGKNFLDYVPILHDVPAVQQMRGEPSPTQLRIRKSVTVNRPANELYDYWHNLSNLPNFMKHVKSVQDLGEGRSHWVVDVLNNVELEWDAKIIEDRPNEMIAWETLPEAPLQNRGYVKFIPTEHGTEVSVSLEYDPPGAAIGKLAGRMGKFIAEHQIKEEIRSFKQLMETGEIPTTEGQPAGRPRERMQNMQHGQVH
jgi:uncharacterized membrane protein